MSEGTRTMYFMHEDGATQFQANLIQRYAEELADFEPAKLALENIAHTIDLAEHAERQRALLNELKRRQDADQRADWRENGTAQELPPNFGKFQALASLISAMQTLLVYAPQHNDLPQE